MKPILEKIQFTEQRFLKINRFTLPYFDIPLHFHPEYELTLITESSGNRFVGDHVERFESGDLVLMGSGIPHVWLNDRIYYENQAGLQASALVLLFSDRLFPEAMLKMNECQKVARLLEKSKYGLKITGRAKEKVIQQMLALERAEGVYRITGLIELLDLIESTDAYQRLCASGNSADNSSELIDRRLQRVTTYLVNNYHQDISLVDLAGLINMNKSAFCRYFKAQTGKTFTRYLNEMRIRYACKLLMDANFSISQVCYECGFNNLSYFNRQFKLLMKQTPKVYREGK